MDLTTTAEARSATGAPRDTQAVLRLLTWLSPAFPVGGFAYSGGLERAVADGLVRKANELSSWIAALMERGGAWNDSVLLAAAHGAKGDVREIAALGALAAALASGRERHDETLALGSAFLDAARNWPHPIFAHLPETLAYPVAVGAVAGVHGVGLMPLIAGFFNAFAAQAVSSGIRLSVLGQREGVKMLAMLEPKIEALAAMAAVSTLDDLGGATILADICGLRHEIQTTRLFRS